MAPVCELLLPPELLPLPELLSDFPPDEDPPTPPTEDCAAPDELVDDGVEAPEEGEEEFMQLVLPLWTV